MHTVCDDNAVLALNGFVCYGFRKVDGKEDGVHLTAYGVEGSFK